MSEAMLPERGLTAVAGLAVGHHTDARRPTGCTVVLCEAGAVCGVDVRGAAPGTRETELLSPLNTVPVVHGLVLAGGSAFGLDAAGGAMRFLESRGAGIAVGPRLASGEPARVPIVPAAILFDLWVGDPRIRPDADAGEAACRAASDAPVAEGNVGAGAGCTIGKLHGIERAMRGGLGSASLQAGGSTVAALVVVNAMGDIVDPATGALVAGARATPDGLDLLDQQARLVAGDWPSPLRLAEGEGAATTLAVVATDAVLDKAGANRLAQVAHDGLARTIRPVHTASDGDTVFALATGASGRRLHPTLLGALAAEAVARAVLRAVRAAATLRAPGLPWLPSARDLVPQDGSAAPS